jgi:quinol monooxygenase YgiN
MGHIRANPGLYRRCASGTLQKTRAGQNRLLEVEKNAEKMISRVKNRTFGVFARIRGMPDKADEVRQRLQELIALTRTESGCLSCDLIEHRCDSTEFTILEEWSPRKDNSAYFASDRIRRAMKCLAGLLTAEFDIHQYALRLNSVKYGTNSYCLAAGLPGAGPADGIQFHYVPRW